MELRRYARIIGRRIVVILVCVLVGGGVGYATTSRTPAYRASATMYVGSRAVNKDPQQIYNQLGLAQIANTFATMIVDPGVARSAIQLAHVSRDSYQVAAATTASVIPATTLIQVSVTDRDPLVAERLVNATVDAFSTRAQNFNGSPVGTPGQLPAEPVYVYQQATTPGAPLSTGARNHAILGAVFGLILAILGVLLLEYLDVTARDPAELERRCGLMVLGTIPLRSAGAEPPHLASAGTRHLPQASQ